LQGQDSSCKGERRRAVVVLEKYLKPADLMRLFECTACGQSLFFESATCESCGCRLGFLPAELSLVALESKGEAYECVGDTDSRTVRLCANAELGKCNWLVTDSDDSFFCRACRHNRTIPDLSSGNNLDYWRRIEVAKRRLFYSLLRLRLPLPDRRHDSHGLAFDFLAPTSKPVMTGHLDGVITINLTEADDAVREQQRGQFSELYRTLLGHFRHEIAHFYWDRLIRDSPYLEAFHTIFGDERADYAVALERHHAEGAPENWSDSYITAYASCHPWEDFAETWAHYLHIAETLETARAFGVRSQLHTKNETVKVDVDFDSYTASIDRLLEAWLPLTFALNSVNRSMGVADLYPFVLSARAILKLNFVHARIHGRSEKAASGDGEPAVLRAVVASLRRSGASPQTT
jgi:hypothetical protein